MTHEIEHCNDKFAVSGIDIIILDHGITEQNEHDISIGDIILFDGVEFKVIDKDYCHNGCFSGEVKNLWGYKVKEIC